MEKTVLVVDDDPDIRRMYVTLLEKKGYRVIPRSDAEDLVALVVACEPSTVLIDLMMPGVTGVEAVRRLREDPRTRATRVVMVSALASFQAAQQANDLAVERYLVKPVPIDTIVAAVEGRSPARKPMRKAS